MIEKDIEYYKKDRNTGDLVFDYVVRPSINRNDLHPIPFGATIAIKIFKNLELAVSFTYTIDKEISEGKILGAVAKLKFHEISDTQENFVMGEDIICQDTEIYKKDPDTEKMVLDYILRPRNTRRDNIGPFAVNDTCKVEFWINDTLDDKNTFEYTPTTPISESKILVGLGSVDFVEM